MDQCSTHTAMTTVRQKLSMRHRRWSLVWLSIQRTRSTLLFTDATSLETASPVKLQRVCHHQTFVQHFYRMCCRRKHQKRLQLTRTLGPQDSVATQLSNFNYRVFYCEDFHVQRNKRMQRLIVTFRVSRRRRKMYSGHAVCVCLSVCVCHCLSAAACPHYWTDADVTWRNGRGCPLVVHFWVDLQSVHRLCCYNTIAWTRNVSECLYSLYAWF